MSFSPETKVAHMSNIGRGNDPIHIDREDRFDTGQMQLIAHKAQCG